MNDMPNEVNLEHSKPKNKLLLFGGIGCFLVLLLCVGGIGVFAYLGSGMAQDIVQEMASVEGSLETSDEVIAAVGSPVKVTPGQPTQRQVDGVPHMIFSGTVSGPDGEGTYEAKFTVEGMEGIDLQSLTVDAGGKLIELSAEDEIDLGIELGE